MRSSAINLVGFKARTDQRPFAAVYQHFRQQRTGIVGSRLHRAIGAGRHDRKQVAGLGFGYVAIEAEEISALADRADDVGADAASPAPGSVTGQIS